MKLVDLEPIERLVEHITKMQDAMNSITLAKTRMLLTEQINKASDELAARIDALSSDVVKLPSAEQFKKLVQTFYVEAQKPKNDGKSFVTRLSDMLHERLSKGGSD